VIAAALLAAALAAAPCGLPAARGDDRPWRVGETLTFDLDVLGVVKTGTLQLSVERPLSGGKIVTLRARAKTTSAAANLKRFTGVALSWIDAATLLPERYRDETEEDGVRKISDARLLPPGPDIVLEQEIGAKKTRTAVPRVGDVLDPLSALARLRAARLAPGDRFCFDLVANRRVWRVEASVAAKSERVETPAGRFDTVRVDAVARRADRPPDARSRPVHVWLLTDARRLPVAIVSEVDVGPVRATLSGVRGARAP